MASVWETSWLNSWGNSWGGVLADVLSSVVATIKQRRLTLLNINNPAKFQKLTLVSGEPSVTFSQPEHSSVLIKAGAVFRNTVRYSLPDDNFIVEKSSTPTELKITKAKKENLLVGFGISQQKVKVTQ